MSSRRRFSFLAMLGSITWISGSLVIFGPGLASRSDAADWLLLGVTLQLSGLLLWWLHHLRRRRLEELEAHPESRS